MMTRMALTLTLVAALTNSLMAQVTVGPIRNSQTQSKYPYHWGQEPTRQTRDLRRLPGGYGTGSSTLAIWIQMNLDGDAVSNPNAPQKKFPAHWPPLNALYSTLDRVTFPGGYGSGASTTRSYIQKNMAADAYHASLKQTSVPGRRPVNPPPANPQQGNPQQGNLPQHHPPQGNPQPQKYPSHWGRPPLVQGFDLVPLPGGYGRGSSTLRAWIQRNLTADINQRTTAPPKYINPIGPAYPSPQPPSKQVWPPKPQPPSQQVWPPQNFGNTGA